MIDYVDDLIKSLEDPEEALEYLKAAHETGNQEVIDTALANIYEASANLVEKIKKVRKYMEDVRQHLCTRCVWTRR